MNTAPTMAKPAWQIERAQLLQSICIRIKSEIEGGKPLGDTIRKFSGLFNRQPYASEPTRQFLLSPGSLRRYWDDWLAAGENQQVFKLNYASRPSSVSDSQLALFIEHIARTPYHSFHDAWKGFTTPIMDTAGLVTKPSVTFSALRHRFPPRRFKELQRALQARLEADAKLNELKKKVFAEIRAGEAGDD